jgi:hypothetical protein
MDVVVESIFQSNHCLATISTISSNLPLIGYMRMRYTLNWSVSAWFYTILDRTRLLPQFSGELLAKMFSAAPGLFTCQYNDMQSLLAYNV